MNLLFSPNFIIDKHPNKHKIANIKSKRLFEIPRLEHIIAIIFSKKMN